MRPYQFSTWEAGSIISSVTFSGLASNDFPTPPDYLSLILIINSAFKCELSSNYTFNTEGSVASRIRISRHPVGYRYWAP